MMGRLAVEVVMVATGGYTCMVGTTIRFNWRMGGVASVSKEVDGIDLETAAEEDVDGNVEHIVVEGGKPPPFAGIGKEGFPAIP